MDPNLDDYFKNNFNTQLSPEDELRFQEWATKINRQNDTIDYDLRGAFQKYGPDKVFSGGNGHAGDAFKKPNHPTFSNQSIYHGYENQLFGGNWEGGTWTGNDFRPSLKMMNTTHDKHALQDYWKRAKEPGKLFIKGF